MGAGAEDYGPRGNETSHLPLETLEAGLDALPAPPRDHGQVKMIVARRADGTRETPEQITLTPERGVPGDRWQRLLSDHPEMPDHRNPQRRGRVHRQWPAAHDVR